MPRLIILVTLLLAPALGSCIAQSYASKIDDRTYRIEGAGVPGGADAPNRRVAERVCPGGYRVVDRERFKVDPAEGTYTNWVIRCL